MGVKKHPTADFLSEAASPTVEELILELQTSFFSAEFKHVAKTLTEREEQIKEKYLKLKTKIEEEKGVLSSENSTLNDELKKKESEIDEMKKLIDEYEEKIRVYKKRCLEFDNKVMSTEKIVKESMGSSFTLENKKQNDGAGESCRPPGFSEKDSKRKTKAKLPNIIHIDDDDDDDDDQELLISFKRRRVLKETKRERPGESAKTSSNLGKVELDSSEPDSGSDNEKIDRAYMSSISKLKKPKQRWKFESDLVKDLEKDDELCLNGICALYRQKIIVYGPDISSVSDLALKLIDGDSQSKLTKKASELSHLDLEDCRMYAKKYSLQLFNIYRDKSDPFFPTS